MNNKLIDNIPISDILISKFIEQQNAREEFAREMMNAIYEKTSNVKREKNIICIDTFKRKKYSSCNNCNFSILEKTLFDINLKINDKINIESIFLQVKKMFSQNIYRNNILTKFTSENKIYNSKINSLYIKIILYFIFSNSVEMSKKYSRIDCKVFELESSIYISIKDYGFEYEPHLISQLRFVRGDSDLFFTDKFIICLIRYYGGTIIQNYDDSGNATIITIPKF